jgi:hypothetical protein
VTAEAFLKFALRRALWAQDFAARLIELGAPASVEALLALGREQFQHSRVRDAEAAAETVWSEWPTES